MDRRLKTILIIALSIVTVSLPALSLQVNDRAEQVIFLEHYMAANGTVVTGEAPYRSVNFPTYWYNENTGQINGKVDFPINDSLKMIFGDVLTLKGNFGAGTGNKLYGVYAFPVFASKAYVYGTDTMGNAVMRINGQDVVLRPGENYTYSENETLRDGKAIIKVRYDQTYVNHGYIDKSNIISG